MSEEDKILSESDNNSENDEKIVLKNKEKTQLAKAKRQISEHQRKVLEVNIKKAKEKRSEMKPVNEEGRSDAKKIKYLERLVKNKEATAKKNELLKRLAELDETINQSKIIVEKSKSKKKIDLVSDDEATEEVYVKKPKKKVKKIIVEDEPSVSETIVVKRRGRPSTKKTQPTEPIVQQNDFQQVALKTAIQQQTNKLLYNQLFGL